MSVDDVDLLVSMTRRQETLQIEVQNVNYAVRVWVRMNGETHSMREFNRTDELQGHIRDMRDTLQRDGWTTVSTKKR